MNCHRCGWPLPMLYDKDLQIYGACRDCERARYMDRAIAFLAAIDEEARALDDPDDEESPKK